jgi:hypothetical protein
LEIIRDEDTLLRRVQYLYPNFIKDDGTPASSSFSIKKGEDELPVDLKRLTTHAQAIQNRNRFRLFALRAGFTSPPGLKNIHNPTQNNYAHPLIVGENHPISCKKSGKKCSENSLSGLTCRFARNTTLRPFNLETWRCFDCRSTHRFARNKPLRTRALRETPPTSIPIPIKPSRNMPHQPN